MRQRLAYIAKREFLVLELAEKLGTVTMGKKQCRRTQGPWGTSHSCMQKKKSGFLEDNSVYT